MSTCRAKRIRPTPGHCPRLTFLDPFAVLCRTRTGEEFGRAHRCFPALRATGALLTLLFLAGCSFCVAAPSKDLGALR